jgi:hypothetical protein
MLRSFFVVNHGRNQVKKTLVVLSLVVLAGCSAVGDLFDRVSAAGGSPLPWCATAGEDSTQVETPYCRR